MNNLLASMLKYEQMKYEQAIKRLDDPKYTRANSQWADSFVKNPKNKIKVISKTLTVSLFLWGIVIVLSVISLLT